MSEPPRRVRGLHHCAICDTYVDSITRLVAHDCDEPPDTELVGEEAVHDQRLATDGGEDMVIVSRAAGTYGSKTYHRDSDSPRLARARSTTEKPLSVFRGHFGPCSACCPEAEAPDIRTDGGETVTTAITVGTTAQGKPVSLPIEDLLTGRGAILGKSGSGKSNTASVVVEKLLAAGYGVLVVDVEGEYYGLKEQYELLHAGADPECDVQVGPVHAEKLAALALEQHVPIILDVSGYLDEGGPGEQATEARELVRATAQALFVREKELKQPFLLVVEEIHEFVPEGGGLDDVGQQLVQIGKRGRKRGLGIVGLSQRPADVKKDFLTQANWLVWHRLTWENDTKVVGRILGSEYQDPVQDLADGEAFLTRDWSEAGIERVQFDRKRTFDAGATPGLEDVERPDLKSVGEDLVEELSEISDREAQRRGEIERLEERLDEKDTEIAELEAELERLRTADETLDLLTERLQGGGQEDISAEMQARLEQKNERISELEHQLQTEEARVTDLEADLDDSEQELERLQGYRERVEEAEKIEEEYEAIQSWYEAAPLSAPEGGPSEAVVDERVAELQATVSELRQANEQLRADAGAARSDSSGDRDADVSADPQAAILEEFQEEAVERVVDRFEQLSDRQLQLLKYIESRGRTLSSQKEWAQSALGLDGNPNSTHYSAMKGLVETGFVQKNNDGSIKPATRQLVADELDGYDVDEATVEETYERLLAKLANGGTEGSR